MTDALPITAMSAPSAHVVALIKQFARSVKPAPCLVGTASAPHTCTFIFDLAQTTAQA